MITKVQKEEIDEIIEYSWNVNQMEEKRVRGIPKEYEQLKASFERRVSGNGEILVLRDESIKGVMELYIDGEYIEASGIYTILDYSDVIDPFMMYLKEHYKGYQLDVFYPRENVQAILEMGRIASKKHEMQYEFEFTSKLDIDFDGVEKLVAKEFEPFRELHKKTFPEVYWNTDRLLESSKFDIFVKYEEGEPAGYIVTSSSNSDMENIFFIAVDETFRRRGVAKKLYAAALDHCFNSEKKRVTLQIDEDNIANLELAKSLGVTLIDTSIQFTFYL